MITDFIDNSESRLDLDVWRTEAYVIYMEEYLFLFYF